MVDDRVKVYRALQTALKLLSAKKKLVASVGRIYVLRKDKEGRQVGDWITPDVDKDILEAQIRDTTQAPADEELTYTVTEYEEFPNLGENPQPSAIAAVVSLLQKHTEEVVSAALDVANRDVSNATKLLSLGYTVHKDDEDYAYSVVGDLGGLQKLGDETLSAYFDFEKYGRDLMLEVLNSELRDGRVIVFNQPKKTEE